MTDLIRWLHLIADRYKVVFAENRELPQQFDAVLRTNHEVQQMLRNMQSEKAAAESQVKELSMVVGQVMAENEALTQKTSYLVPQKEVQIAVNFCCVCTCAQCFLDILPASNLYVAPGIGTCTAFLTRAER